MKGWIYILNNRAVPNYLAIGCSDTDPETLVRQYGRSGIKLPYPFELQYALRTQYPQTLLGKIHAELAQHCVNPEFNQDWFECDLWTAMRTIRHYAGSRAMGETFYHQAQQLIEQKQKLLEQAQQQTLEEHHQNDDYPESETVSQNTILNQDDNPENVPQVRTVPLPKHGKRPSPIAPKVARPPAPPPAKPAPKGSPKWLVSFLIAVWVILMMVLVFLVFYISGYF